MTLLKANTAEGGTSGVTASAANSGGASGDAFGSVNVGAGCTYAFDNAHAHRGTLSYKIGSTGTATFFYATQAFTTTGTIFVRAYLYATANPPTFTPIRFVGTGLCGAVILDSTGHLAAMNSGGGTVSTMTNAISLNQWVRVEAKIIGSATVGQIEIKLYNTTDSTTPTETLTTAANINTGSPISEVWWGESGGTANVGPYWMDDIGIDDAAYLGPTITTAAESTTSPVGLSSSSTAAKVAPVATIGSISLAGSGTARKTVAGQGTASLALAGQGTAKRLAPTSTTSPVGIAGYSTTGKTVAGQSTASLGLSTVSMGRKVIARTGSSTIGLTGYGSTGLARQVVTRCSIGLGSAGIGVRTAIGRTLAAVGLSTHATTTAPVTPGTVRASLATAPHAEAREGRSAGAHASPATSPRVTGGP